MVKFFSYSHHGQTFPEALELFLVRELCTQTKQTELLVIWKSKPVFGKGKKIVDQKNCFKTELKDSKLSAYLTKRFVQILYNETSVHCMRPRVTQRGGHVTTVILVRLSVCAVDVLESLVSTTAPRTNEASCNLISNDDLQNSRRKMFHCKHNDNSFIEYIWHPCIG